MENLPSWLTHLLSVAFGLVFGSFVNVVVARLPKKQSIIRPSSQCVHCRKSLRWWDNIPVLSYLLLLGKCRFCKQNISVRYPVIEVLTAALFLATRLRFGWTPLLWIRDWPFVVALVSITFIDLEHRIIPDVLSLGGLVLGLATCWFGPTSLYPGWILSFIGALLGFSLFYCLAWGYYRMTGRSGLGGGDIKLLAMLGAFLGPSGVLATIFISSIFGSVVGISWALVQGKKNVMRMSIPYGPFLVVGALYYYLLGDLLWFQFMTPI